MHPLNFPAVQIIGSFRFAVPLSYGIENGFDLFPLILESGIVNKPGSDVLNAGALQSSFLLKLSESIILKRI